MNAAAVDATLGKGRVILLGIGIEQRAQPHGTFKLLLNSLFYGVSRYRTANIPSTIRSGIGSALLMRFSQTRKPLWIRRKDGVL